MDMFRIINDIAADQRLDGPSKIRMFINILIQTSRKRIEMHREKEEERGKT